MTIDISDIPEIEIDPLRAGGKPVIRGTRFTVAQLLAELSDGDSVGELCEDMQLNLNDVLGILRGLARKLDVKGTGK